MSNKSLVERVLHSINWKKSNRYCADKLGISLDYYNQIKGDILNKTRFNADAPDIDDNAFYEIEENIKEGTARITSASTKQALSADEVIQILKIDLTKWELQRYWNKQKSKGWLVSALVAKKKSNDISIEDVESILGKVFKDKPFQPLITYPTISNQKALFIYLSDRHIAAHVSGVAMYSNDYNGLIYKQRLAEVLHEVFYQKSIYGKFEDIFIIDLGDKMDGLDGYTTRGGHKLPQNMNNRQSFEIAVSAEKEFIDAVIQSDCANNYHVYQNANSNHGGDFDYMVNRALEIYINTKYPQVQTRIFEKFIEHINYGEHCILLTHGKDDADMKHGLPLHLNDKTENYFRKYLMYNKINPDEHHISIVKGDLHISACQYAYGFRYRNVLSLFGGSKWIATNFGPSRPGVSYEIIEKGTDRILEGNVMFQ
jgi:hypothetical protein